MKAIRLHELEGPDELVYEEVPGGSRGPVRVSSGCVRRR